MDTRRTGKHTGWREIFSFLAIFVMLAVMLTGGAAAEQTEAHTHEGWTAWEDSTAIPRTTGKYYLTTDIKIDRYVAGGCRISSGQTVDLCLNGHSITFNFKEKGIDVYGGTLNLYDCGTEVHHYSIDSDNLAVIGEGDKTFTGGYITHTHGYVGPAVHLDGRGVFNMYGGTIIGNLNTKANRNFAGAVYVKEGSTFNLYDGVIAGNSSTEYGGGGVLNFGQFHMYGGEIRDNYGSYGGGVRTDKNCTMSGGTIKDNKGQYGGGVYVVRGTMTMSGGSIADNIATEYCGALENSGTFNMSGGSITGNSGPMDEGCIYNDTNATMNISGGRITGNSSMDGGLYNLGTLKVSGNPVISDNKDNNGNTMNVCLTEGKTITVIGELTSGASIGVTTKQAPEAGAPVIVGSSYGNFNEADPNTVFFSDNNDYGITLKGTDAILAMKYALKFDANGGSGKPPAGGSYTEGTEIEIPGKGDMSFTGRAFAGWGREPGSSLSSALSRETSDGNLYAPGDTIVMDGDITLYAQWAEAHTATWQDGDGSKLDEKNWQDGEPVPETEKTPTKKPDEQYIYTFSEWDEPVVDEDGNRVYKPKFTTELQKYTITFVDEDNSVLKAAIEYEYGNVPVKPDDPAGKETEKSILTFAGWSDGTTTYASGEALPEVKKNVTYKAVYSVADKPAATAAVGLGAAPSESPSASPSTTPTATPTTAAVPTATPTAAPTATTVPTATPASTVTAAPTATPVSTITAAPTVNPTTAPTATPKPVPKTGDSEDLFLWTGLMVLCAGVLAAMLVAIPYLKRRK